MSLSTFDMYEFLRGYDHAMEVVSSHTKMARTTFGANIVRSFAKMGPGHWFWEESRWFREGSDMAIAECEENWRRSQLNVGPYRQAT